MRPFPGRLVFDDRRPLRILEALEAVALEFKLARLGLQPLEVFAGIIGWQRLRLGHILFSVLPEPAKRNRRAQLFLLGRHDVITFSYELLPRYAFGQIGRIELSFLFFYCFGAHREVVGEAEALAEL